MLEKIRKIVNSSDYHKSLRLMFILVLVISIPLVVILAMRTQEIRQRAGGNPITPPYAPVTFEFSPSTLTKTPGEYFDVNILLNAGQMNIIGVDYKVNYTRNGAISTASIEPNTSVFNDVLINKEDISAGSWRFAAVNTTSKQITGTINLGTIRYLALNSGTASVSFSDVQITAFGYNESIAYTGSVGTYTIATSTPTVVPPTSTPVITFAPTNTPIPTTTPTAGDINGDASIDILDYNIWRNEFLKLVTTEQADLNKDGRIDLLDFAIWRNVFNPGTSLTPTPIVQTAKRVFITGTTSDGNLQLTGSKWGLGTATNGLDGANKICQGSANTANLGGTWKAWLSDSTTSAASRLTHSVKPYIIPTTNNVIATSWNDLTDGSALFNAIDKDEFGNNWNSYLVWSNTNTNGDISQAVVSGTGNCSNWTSASSSDNGRIGTALTTTPYWTSDLYSPSQACNISYIHLYCFEQ